jgi:3-phenylpropionate/trans-cinnamate dioxygenase ferredoxin reductase subunit
MTGSPMVIVGGGLAGAKAAEKLRELGYDGDLTLIGDEPDRPYERPPLSKEYLNGKSERDKVFVHPPDWYAEHDVDLRLGQPAAGLDRQARTVRLADNTTIGYDRLLIATGSTPRTLAVPGGDHAGLLYLRRLADSDRIRAALATAAKLVIVGAGWIGLEVAAAARTAGVDVTIVEVAQLPLLRVLGPEIARSFADLHAAHNVDLRFGTQLTEVITDEDRPCGIRLADGTTIEADAVLVGIGAAPNVRLAQDAGLAVSDGIDVDAQLRTSDDRIFAAGDVAAAEHPLLGRRIRVEHWANALNQPAVAAANMLGQQVSYDRLPYFYTDQYDLGMEYVGYVETGDYDRVTVRGNLESREYIAFWTKANRVQAAMSVNVWDVIEDLKAIVSSGAETDAERLADSSVPLSELAGPSQ